MNTNKTTQECGELAAEKAFFYHKVWKGGQFQTSTVLHKNHHFEGTQMKALIVGGERTFIKNVLSPRLAKEGIVVEAIWDWDKSKPIQSIPSGCNSVIVVKDMTNHGQRDAVRLLARRGGLPFAEIPRKWAVAYNDLIKAGFIQRGDSVSRTRKKTNGDVLILQEDYTQTFGRIIVYSKKYFEKKARRPKAKEVSTALHIPTYHPGMQKGINQGISEAKGEIAPLQENQKLSELLDIALQDNPEWVLEPRSFSKFLSEMMGKANDEAWYKEVRLLALATRRRWKQASAASRRSPERIFLCGLKAKWMERHCRTAYVDNQAFPVQSDLNNICRKIFESGLPVDIQDQVFTELKQELEPMAPQIAKPEVEVAKPLPVEEPKKMPTKKSKSLQSPVLREAIGKYIDMLGKTYDCKIAELAGCSGTSVSRYRNELGIPPFKPTSNVPSKPMEVSLAQVEIVDLRNEIRSLRDDHSALLDSTARLEGEINSNRAAFKKLEERLAESEANGESVTQLTDQVATLQWGLEKALNGFKATAGSMADDTPTNNGAALGTVGAAVEALIEAGMKVQLVVDNANLLEREDQRH